MVSSSKSLLGMVAALVAVTASFFGCARLLWAVSVRLAPTDRRRLFPRQLRSLAVAGLFVSICAFPIVLIDLGHMEKRPVLADGVCRVVYKIFRPARFVSVLQETHIALTFLAQIVRATKLLRCLNHGIPAIWILGVLLGGADAVLFPFHFDDHYQCQSERVDVDVISICVVGLCVLTSCIASVTIFAKATASFTTLAVRRRSFKRAVCYPCISVLSYMPIMIAYGFPILFESPGFVVICICEFSNGAMNAGMFCLQSHYASRLASKAQENGESDTSTADVRQVSDDIQSVASFNVGFGSVDVVELLWESSASVASAASAGSFEGTHAGAEGQ